jgi:hypothetical protein
MGIRLTVFGGSLSPSFFVFEKKSKQAAKRKGKAWQLFPKTIRFSVFNFYRIQLEVQLISIHLKFVTTAI